jgi:hypothetical protein
MKRSELKQIIRKVIEEGKIDTTYKIDLDKIDSIRSEYKKTVLDELESGLDQIKTKNPDMFDYSLNRSPNGVILLQLMPIDFNPDKSNSLHTISRAILDLTRKLEINLDSPNSNEISEGKKQSFYIEV